MADRGSQSREQVEQQIVQKAATDPAFRQQLLRDPRAALAGQLGAPLPQGVQVSVLEETPSHSYIVLPPTEVQAGPSSPTSNSVRPPAGRAIPGTTPPPHQDETAGELLSGRCGLRGRAGGPGRPAPTALE